MFFQHNTCRESAEERQEGQTEQQMELGVGVDKTAEQQNLYAMLFSHRHKAHCFFVFSGIAIEEEQNTLSPMELGVGVGKTAEQHKLYAMLFSHRH